MFLNNFGIVVTHDDFENQLDTHFLDLRLIVNDNTNSIGISTYRKPTCSYNYVPFSSCHSMTVKMGIVATECVRMLVTNCDAASFETQIHFFMGKLKLRGYDLRAVRRIVDRYGFERREQFLGNGARIRDKRKIVPFKTPSSEGLASLGIESIVRNIASELCSDTRAKLRIIVCFTASKNLFRIRYGRFK